MTPPTLPPDHAARLARARLALDGLSVGDAFGSQFFLHDVYTTHFHSRTTPPGPWRYTDDTEMGLGIFEVLESHGAVEQYELARVFGRRYHNEIYRGYGPGAHGILSAIHQGTPWRNVAYSAFGGSGSLGNGAAMRVAPVGAYFADDLPRCAREASASAEVTHAHPEGRAGAVAVAIASAWAWNHREQTSPPGALLAAVLEYTPNGTTRTGLQGAAQLPAEAPAEQAAEVLGNGRRATAPDTVPFALWCAGRFLRDYPAALWACVSVGGDVDTTCAIVGGVVALASATTIPQTWLAAREPLDFDGGRHGPQLPGR
jgi:ADP-ribosylglycohydrolase